MPESCWHVSLCQQSVSVSFINISILFGPVSDYKFPYTAPDKNKQTNKQTNKNLTAVGIIFI